MKHLVPLIILIFAALACTVPESSKIKSQNEEKASKTMLSYTPPRMTSDRVSWLVQGQVQNVSGENLEFVKARVTFLDKDGNFVSSETGYHIEKWRGLGPDEKSTYVVQTPFNPQIKSFEIEFADNDHGTLRSNQVPKL